MLKLEEFVNEKLKISKNYRGVNIKTTLLKFFAWYTGYNEFTINRFDLKDMDFISSDESMTKNDINDFLYKHINDEINIIEEEKRASIESRSGLYTYSFDIEGITFNIDARLYSGELLSQSKDYIIEKLKVSTKELVPFEKISVAKFASALRKSGTILIKDYTNYLICDRRYSKSHSYNEMYLYSIGVQEKYPAQIEFQFRTKDRNGIRRDHIRNEDELILLSRFAGGEGFKLLIEEIYNDITK